MKQAFLKNMVAGGAGAQDLPPHFSGRHPVHETGKALHPQVALVCSLRTDGDGVPCNLPHQLFAVRFGCSDELAAQRPGHFEVDFISVHALFGLPDNNVSANPTCKVERSQICVDFLLRESARPSVEIDKAQCVLYFKSWKLVSISQRKW